MEGILKEVKRLLRNQRVDLKGKTILVAVSGGPDSMFLMHLLSRLSPEEGLQLIVAHLEHGMRPKEDPIETEFVHNQAQKLGLKSITRRLDQSIWTQRGSKEELMRIQRLRILKSIASEYGCDYIALGHQMDDQVETFLMRLLRGAGSTGLGGMRVRSGQILRPLLWVAKDEILKCLEENNIPYVSDPTNMDKGILRNRIRLELVPFLKQYQPKILKRISCLAELMANESDYLGMIARQWLEKHSTRNANSVQFNVADFLKEPEIIKTYILKEAYKNLNGSTRGLSYLHIMNALNMINSEKVISEISLPYKTKINKEYGKIFLRKGIDYGIHGYCLEISGPGLYEIPEFGAVISVEILPSPPQGLDCGTNTAHFDFQKVHFPLKVRPPVLGDWFVPLGMGGKKKLQDLFVDLKIPRASRKKWPLILSGDEIIRVAGVRIDDRYKVTKGTGATLRLVLGKKEGPLIQ
jgi:tRNA(Ile)-lysidine synthase